MVLKLQGYPTHWNFFESETALIILSPGMEHWGKLRYLREVTCYRTPGEEGLPGIPRDTYLVAYTTAANQIGHTRRRLSQKLNEDVSRAWVLMVCSDIMVVDGLDSRLPVNACDPMSIGFGHASQPPNPHWAETPDIRAKEIRRQAYWRNHLSAHRERIGSGPLPDALDYSGSAYAQLI